MSPSQTIDVLEQRAPSAAEGAQRQVEEWRLEQLLRAGWPRTLAPLVALDPHVELHLACELLERGCAPETALRILL